MAKANSSNEGLAFEDKLWATADQLANFFITPESNPLVYLMLQFAFGHIGLFPAILGNDPFVDLGGLVDYFINQGDIALITFANQLLPLSSLTRYYSLGIYLSKIQIPVRKYSISYSYRRSVANLFRVAC
jgi:hypothetical protein